MIDIETEDSEIGDRYQDLSHRMLARKSDAMRSRLYRFPSNTSCCSLRVLPIRCANRSSRSTCSSFNRMLSTLAMILPQTSPPSNGNIDPLFHYIPDIGLWQVKEIRKMFPNLEKSHPGYDPPAKEGIGMASMREEIEDLLSGPSCWVFPSRCRHFGGVIRVGCDAWLPARRRSSAGDGLAWRIWMDEDTPEISAISERCTGRGRRETIKMVNPIQGS